MGNTPPGEPANTDPRKDGTAARRAGPSSAHDLSAAGWGLSALGRGEHDRRAPATQGEAFRAESHGNGGGDASFLAAALEPLLRQACEGRLSEVRWFRSAWQAGGASTGLATFALDDGTTTEVVVKLPVGPTEYRWTTALGGMPHVSEHVVDGPLDGEETGRVEVCASCACAMGPTPRVYAAGTCIGGYDLAWLVMERFEGDPLSRHLSRGAIEDLLNAAAEWYAAAQLVRLPEDAAPPLTKDWRGLIERSASIVDNGALDDEERWHDATHAVLGLLPRILGVWESRPINTWCHGDLHPGNAMRRAGAWWYAGHMTPTRTRTGENAAGPGVSESRAQPDPIHGAARGGASPGGCTLIDLALVHPGHWVEDAVYLERLYWGRSDLLEGVRPVPFLAQARRERGMSSPEDYTLLANIRRVLMAACVPNFLKHEGHPRYVSAALDVLERLLPVVRSRVR